MIPPKAGGQFKVRWDNIIIYSNNDDNTRIMI